MSRSRHHRRNAALAAKSSNVIEATACPVPLPADPSADRDSAAPSHEQVAERAREIWEHRGCPQGQDLDIWLTAEGELREQVR